MGTTDTTPPTVVFSDNLAGIANLSTNNFVYTLTFNEPVTGLTADDFNISNAAINSITGAGETWSVNVTPATGVATGFISLTLNAGAVSDAAGNFNEVANDSNQGIDTLAVAPKLVTSTDFYSLTNPQITMVTNHGTAVIELYPQQAPMTVANLLAYVDADFYDGTMFHRVIPDFMVQGGGFNNTGHYLNPMYAPISLESNNNLSNLRGTVAMARSSAPNSATTQFFVNLVDNTFLNYRNETSPGYAVFGEVISGMSTFDAIAQVETTTVGSYENVPLTLVETTSVELTQTGSSVVNIGATITLSGLESGAVWSYSLDSGAHWSTGSGHSFELPLGQYTESDIQVKQTDTAGNTSTTSVLTSAVVVQAAITGTDESNDLIGTAGDDLIIAHGGNDVIVSGSGRDAIDGGSGTDTIGFPSSISDFSIVASSDNTAITHVLSSGSVALLTSVERAVFSDFIVNFTIQTKAAAIDEIAEDAIVSDLIRLEELYIAFFNRTPDANGLEFWIDQFIAGKPITGIAEDFYGAGVYYSSLTGYSESMTNDDFIGVVYKNVLGRESVDQEGLDHWNGELNEGRATRGTLVNDILDAAHTYKGNAEWGWVVELLENKAEVATQFSVEWGLNYTTPEESISQGMAISAAITPDDITAAIELIGITAGSIDLGDFV